MEEPVVRPAALPAGQGGTATDRRASAGAALRLRPYAAVVFDWDGTAVATRHGRAEALRARVETLSLLGVDLAVISGTRIEHVDPLLGARPAGPGGLWYALNRGAELFEVGRDGPVLRERHAVSREQDRLLDQAATMAADRFAAHGLTVALVPRWNRRKLDLLPEPAWREPRKDRLGEVAAESERRLRAAGLEGLSGAVHLLRQAAAEAGLEAARITSDGKHLEIGVTDKSDATRRVLDVLWRRGVGPGLVLVAGDEFGPLGGVAGSDSLLLVDPRLTAVSVGPEPQGVPAGVTHLGGGPQAFLAVLDALAEAHREGRVPPLDTDPGWTLLLEGDDPEQRRVHESLTTVADGVAGTRGAAEEHALGSHPLTVLAGVYAGRHPLDGLLSAPGWTGLRLERLDRDRQRRLLDLRTGVLLRECPASDGVVRTLRFAALARPGVGVLLAEGPPGVLEAGAALSLPEDAADGGRGRTDQAQWAVTRATPGGGVRAVARQIERGVVGARTVVRVASLDGDDRRVPGLGRARTRLESAWTAGAPVLLREQRAAWARRWQDADVRVHGDEELTLAARLAMFHVLGSVADRGEAAVGARGLTGSAYAGHVFWDADVYDLPLVAATNPRAARAMLAYRVRRLPAARALAVQRGHAGARFPWESAGDGTEATPASARLPDGTLLPIRTRTHAEHIVAAVAWAAWWYAQWTGDDAFLRGPGLPLLTDTARYWTSRARRDRDGRAHLYGVEGPDEYHAPVDDNAYTNVMARWNLRRAAELVEALVGGPDAEATGWRELADALVDGWDPTTGRYEQFSGFFKLEPLIIGEVAEVPVAADLLLGPGRTAAAQVVKQPDVLLLHHLVPEEVVPGSLEENLDYYGPRTAHGSSLSPAVHAALLLRAGRFEEGLDFLRLAALLDLDDLTGTSGAGLHLATMGGVWQAFAWGVAGLRPVAGALAVDPRLPPAWEALELRVRFRGRRLWLRIGHDAVEVKTDGPVAIRTWQGVRTVTAPGARLPGAREETP